MWTLVVVELMAEMVEVEIMVVEKTMDMVVEAMVGMADLRARITTTSQAHLVHLVHLVTQDPKERLVIQDEMVSQEEWVSQDLQAMSSSSHFQQGRAIISKMKPHNSGHYYNSTCCP
jgi:propanediol dehydratase large subunit